VDDAGRSHRPTWRRTVVDAVIVTTLWLVLAGDTGWQEVLAAAVTGVAAAAYGARARRHVGHEGVLPPGSARALGDAAIGALTDTWPLTRALVARLRGEPSRSRIREVDFHVGDEGRRDASRRALATLTCSLQPNSYLVGFDPERDVALVHELVPTDDPPITNALRSPP
jgi:multisubunit Na+/H+ antiporter MnhE subunit